LPTWRRLINIFTVHIGVAVTACMRPLQRCFAGGAVMQSQLDDALAPPPFLIPVRTAAVLNTLFTCLAYSGGHPILLAVAGASYTAMYWVDRWAVLRLYRRPPRYDAKLASWVVACLPWAICVHLLFSVWMYGDPTVTYSTTYAGPDAQALIAVSTLDEPGAAIGGVTLAGNATNVLGVDVRARLQRENTLPMFLLWLAFLGVWFATSAAGRLLVEFVLNAVFCGQCARLCRRCCAGGEPQVTNPPLTGPFAIVLPYGEKASLTPAEVARGVRFWRDPHGQWVRVVLWTRETDPDSEHLGLPPRVLGQRLQTREVIASTGLDSYHIEDNPAYRATALAIEAARAADAEAERAAAAKPSVDGVDGGDDGAGAGVPPMASLDAVATNPLVDRGDRVAGMLEAAEADTPGDAEAVVVVADAAPSSPAPAVDPSAHSEPESTPGSSTAAEAGGPDASPAAPTAPAAADPAAASAATPPMSVTAGPDTAATPPASASAPAVGTLDGDSEPMVVRDVEEGEAASDAKQADEVAAAPIAGASPAADGAWGEVGTPLGATAEASEGGVEVGGVSTLTPSAASDGKEAESPVVADGDLVASAPAPTAAADAAADVAGELAASSGGGKEDEDGTAIAAGGGDATAAGESGVGGITHGDGEAADGKADSNVA
jgi:hypothetical protein